MRRSATTVTALYATGAPGSTWRIHLADGATYEVQFATSQPTIVRRGSDVASDRHPRRLAALEANLGEPLRFTMTGQRERYEAVVMAITRVRPFCGLCGDRLLAGVCSRNLVDPTHHRSHQETKWAGKPLPWRRRLGNRLEPILHWLDGR
jgi:hypothetical protein